MREKYIIYSKNYASGCRKNELGSVDENGGTRVMPVSIRAANTTTGECWSATHQGNATTSVKQEKTTSTEAIGNIRSRKGDGLSYTDHGWAWMVLVGSCTNAFVMSVAASCFPVLFVEFVLVFREKKSSIVLVGSLQYGITLISGPVFSRLCEKYSYRLVIMAGGALATCGMCLSYVGNDLIVLTLTFGVLTGTGRGMIYAPSQTITAFYFDKKLALVTGLIPTLSALGALTGPPLCAKILELYTWQGAMIIIGGMYLQTIAASALLRDIPKAAKEELKKLRNKRWFMMPATDMLKFGLHCLSHVLYGIGLSIVLLFVVLYGTRQGMSLASAALMLTTLNISNILSRFLVAIVGDRRWFPRQLVYAVATLACGIISLLFLFAAELWVFALCCVLYGTSYGVKQSLRTCILVDLFGIQNIPMVKSIYCLFRGVGGLIGPVVAGFLMDQTGNMRSVFVLCAITGIGSGVLQCGVIYMHYRQRSGSQEPPPLKCTEAARNTPEKTRF